MTRQEYVAALVANSAAPREDSQAMMAEALRALADVDQLRADRDS